MVRGSTFFHGLSTIPRVLLTFECNVHGGNEYQHHSQEQYLAIKAPNVRISACDSCGGKHETMLCR